MRPGLQREDLGMGHLCAALAVKALTGCSLPDVPIQSAVVGPPSVANLALIKLAPNYPPQTQIRSNLSRFPSLVKISICMQIKSITTRKQRYSIFKRSMKISSAAHSRASSWKHSWQPSLDGPGVQAASLPPRSALGFRHEHIFIAFLRRLWLQSSQQAGLLIKGGRCLFSESAETTQQ